MVVTAKPLGQQKAVTPEVEIPAMAATPTEAHSYHSAVMMSLKAVTEATLVEAVTLKRLVTLQLKAVTAVTAELVELAAMAAMVVTIISVSQQQSTANLVTVSMQTVATVATQKAAMAVTVLP
jgi:hypothetical protein